MKNNNKIVLFIFLILFINKAYFLCNNHFSSSSNDDTLSEKNGCLVLCYHRVQKSHSLNYLAREIANISEVDSFTIFDKELKKQLNFIKKNNIPIITCAELEAFHNNKIDLPSKCILITFDDVDISVYKYAFPILNSERIPFTLFIISGKVGDIFDNLQLCSWKQLREMYNSNLATIGLHTHNLHYKNSKGIPVFLEKKNQDKFDQDLKISKAIVTKELGVEPKYFCYPYGFGNPQTDELLINAGIKLIFSLGYGVQTAKDSPFYIKRILVNPKTWPIIEKWIEQ